MPADERPEWHCHSLDRMLCFLSCVGIYGLRAQVTFDRLLNSAKEPQNWLTYSGDYSGRRFSPLDQINVANAHIAHCQVGLSNRSHRQA